MSIDTECSVYKGSVNDLYLQDRITLALKISILRFTENMTQFNFNFCLNNCNFQSIIILFYFIFFIIIIIILLFYYLL